MKTFLRRCHREKWCVSFGAKYIGHPLRASKSLMPSSYITPFENDANAGSSNGKRQVLLYYIVLGCLGFLKNAYGHGYSLLTILRCAVE